MRTSKTELPELLELTRSVVARDRRRALAALCPCEVKSHNPEVWQRILEMGGDPDASVRRWVVHVLCDGSPAKYQTDIVRVLESRYHDEDRGVRRMARHVLAKYRHTGSLNQL